MTNTSNYLALLWVWMDKDTNDLNLLGLEQSDRVHQPLRETEQEIARREYRAKSTTVCLRDVVQIWVHGL